MRRSKIKKILIPTQLQLPVPAPPPLREGKRFFFCHGTCRSTLRRRKTFYRRGSPQLARTLGWNVRVYLAGQKVVAERLPLSPGELGKCLVCASDSAVRGSGYWARPGSGSAAPDELFNNSRGLAESRTFVPGLLVHGGPGLAS